MNLYDTVNVELLQHSGFKRGITVCAVSLHWQETRHGRHVSVDCSYLQLNVSVVTEEQRHAADTSAAAFKDNQVSPQGSLASSSPSEDFHLSSVLQSTTDWPNSSGSWADARLSARAGARQRCWCEDARPSSFGPVVLTSVWLPQLNSLCCMLLCFSPSNQKSAQSVRRWTLFLLAFLETQDKTFLHLSQSSRREASCSNIDTQITAVFCHYVSDQCISALLERNREANFWSADRFLMRRQTFNFCRKLSSNKVRWSVEMFRTVRSCWTKSSIYE